MVAAEGGRVKTVVALIEHGANVNLNDRVKLLESIVYIISIKF